MTNAEFLNRLGNFWARYAEELSFGQFLDNFFDITEIDFRAYSNEEILELLAKKQSEDNQVRAFKFKISDWVRWANKALRPKMSIGQIIDIITDSGVQPRYKIEILEGADAGLVVEPNAYWADVGGLEFAPDRIRDRGIPQIPRLVKRKRRPYKLWWSNASGCNASGCNASGCNASGCNGVLLGKYATRLEAERDLFAALRECHELDDQDGLYDGLISCKFRRKNIFVIDNLIPF